MVATAAGVHLSTVSLALRNDPRLPAATRERIRGIAQRLGYAPNPLVSLLMARVRRRDGGYRGTLGYVHTVPAGTPRLAGQVHRNFVSGARARALNLGYTLDEFYLEAGAGGAKRLARVLDTRGIGGLVIEHVPGPLCPGRVLPFDTGAFATASLGVPLARPALHYVANDQFMRAVVAAREVLALGYRRPGLVVVNAFDSAMAHRCSAGFWAVQEYVAGVGRVPICRVGDDGGAAVVAWLRRHRPDVVLATNVRVGEWLAAAGVRVPGGRGAGAPRLAARAPAARRRLRQQRAHRGGGGGPRGVPAAPRRVRAPGPGDAHAGRGHLDTGQVAPARRAGAGPGRRIFRRSRRGLRAPDRHGARRGGAPRGAFSFSRASGGRSSFEIGRYFNTTIRCSLTGIWMRERCTRRTPSSLSS